MKKTWRLTVRVKMDWCDQIALSIKSVFRGLAYRLGICRSGPMKLRQDVRRCDYDDVRVMWEMLKKKNRAELGRRPPSPPSSPSSRTRSSSLLNVFEWARCSCP